MRSTGANPYTGVYLLYNTEGKKGFSYNLTASIDKAFQKGFAFSFAWTYGGSVVTNENTSSQNNSQWRFMETVNGKNFVQTSTSDFSLGHRFYGYVSKKLSYLENKLATTITLVYNGQQGQPFSYVYNASIIGDDGPTSTNDLIYIPTASELQGQTFTTYTVGSNSYTPAQQKQMLEDYITGNKYLRNHRGQFADRNGDRLPWSHLLDLKLTQDFNVKIAKRTYQLQVSYDVYNFTNMLSHNWGQTYFLTNDQYALIRMTGFVNTTSDFTPQYQFATPSGKPWGLSTSTAPGLSARWISQLGFRVSF